MFGPGLWRRDCYPTVVLHCHKGVIWGCVVLSARLVSAGELKPETVSAWDTYLKTAEARALKRASGAAPFLWAEEDAARMSRVRAGEILVAPVSPDVPLNVPHGLIHDWIGSAFIPNATLSDLFAVIRDYNRYKEFYRPTAVDSKETNHEGDRYSFSMTLVNTSVLLHTGLITEDEAIYTRVDDKRWACTVRTRNVQEIVNMGQSDEEKLPPGTGSGFIWKMADLSRFEERDGGVYVDLEVLALTRDIPFGLRWMVAPMVRNLSRRSLLVSLRQSSEAVRAEMVRAAKAREPEYLLAAATR
jgi:hypothetical protein